MRQKDEHFETRDKRLMSGCANRLILGTCAMAERPRRYMPFAEGPRSCVGKTLAQTTLPLTLAILLSNFSFKLADQVQDQY